MIRDRGKHLKDNGQKKKKTKKPEKKTPQKLRYIYVNHSEKQILK